MDQILFFWLAKFYIFRKIESGEKFMFFIFINPVCALPRKKGFFPGTRSHGFVWIADLNNFSSQQNNEILNKKKKKQKN